MSLNNEPVTVFYSYAHEDEKLRDELAKHLSLLKREGVIKEWHDRRIAPGDRWKDQIDQYLETAELILLLVSPDFMASDYCYDIEMQRALERNKKNEARVIPIILRPVDWSNASFASLQALPTDGKPITEWPNQDRAFLSVVQGIRSAVEQMRSGKTPSRRTVSNKPSLGDAAALSGGSTKTVFKGDISVKNGDFVAGNKTEYHKP